MDRRACPSYVAGFDACDPFGSVVEWTGRGPARLQRRRCRSEGLDRSPYEDGPVHRSVDSAPRHSRALPNKSYFTLNTALEAHFDRLNAYSFTAENGDYIMAHEQKRYQSYHQPGKQKFSKSNITRSPLVTTLSNTKIEEARLPKVEELLEKPGQQSMEAAVPKQPLKSILNNALPKSPPPGILKKPKNKIHNEQNSYKGVKSPDSRRRQRASSESDSLYCTFHLANPIPGYESRLNSYQAINTKRAKDNTGTGYSYGSAIATLSHAPRSPTKNGRCGCREPPPIATKEEVHHMHVLRTTAINNINSEPMDEGPEYEIHRYDSPPRREVSPSLPVSSETVVPAKKPIRPISSKKKIKKPKSPNMKAVVDTANTEAEPEDAHSRSPSPDNDADWAMETDALIAEIERLEKLPRPPASPVPVPVPFQQTLTPQKKESTPPPPPEQHSVTKLTHKLNGAVVTPKKLPSKDKMQKVDNAFLTALHTTNPFKPPSRRDPPLVLPDYVTNCLRTSLFPRVPPYLKFVGHDESPSVKLPMAISKHLKWKLTSITPIVVKKCLVNSGFRLVKSECDTAECPQEETLDWIGIWGKHMKSLMFRAIKDGQKMNHFPGTFQIGRKDRLWRNLQKLVVKFGVKEFGIMPKSYVLPLDLKLLKHDWEKSVEDNEKWIIKPPASARGTGIKVVSRWTQIPKKRPVVVQRYVSKPYLINGSKFDMRLYVLVTSVHPLRIYLFKDGLARFASMKYSDDVASLNDRYMHLTNYSINRLSKNYTPNEDFAACEGHKWTLQTLFSYLKHDKGVDTDSLWASMKDLVIKTIIAGEASISSLTKANITSRYNCYELFGIDVLLDEDLKPWLLEVNISPSLHSASPLDIHVKSPMVTEVLNIAQFQIPTKINLDILAREKPHKLSGLPYDSRLYTVYLSKEERDKHIIYTNMDERTLYLRDILSTLTPDDVRHLIQAEDELTQSNDMERIFPTYQTHKYLQYLAGPRYYNRLFDAWESRYHKHRQSGIDLLRSLCDIGYHLEVPPVPLKPAAPQLSALDRCRMMWTRPHRLFRSVRQLLPSGRWVHAPPSRSSFVATRARGRPNRRRVSSHVHSGTPRARSATTPQRPRLATAAASSGSARTASTTTSRRKCAASTTEAPKDLDPNVHREEALADDLPSPPLPPSLPSQAP